MTQPNHTNGYARRQRVLRRRRRGQGNGDGSSFWLKALIGLALLGVIGVIAAGVSGIFIYRSYADQLVPPDELAINQPSYGAKILDRNGNLLYEYVDDQEGLRKPVPIDQVAPAFLAAEVATEDNSFFTNPGINVKGLLRAAWENTPLGGTVFEGSGGSSITQQLVKNVYIPQSERSARWSAEGVNRKLKEMIYAVELTQRYSKEKILGWYVNQISYGGVYNGIQAAAQGYFGIDAKDLTLAQAALIAGIPASPAAYDPVNNLQAATQRRNEVLDLMLRQGRIQIGEDKYFIVTPEDVAAAKQEPIVLAAKRFPIEAPHFVLQYIQPELEKLYGHDALFRDGLVVTTTLDLDLQKQTQAILEKNIEEYEKISNSHNGAMMIMDPKTAEILVYIGSRDYFNDDIQGKNDNITACNSPGSSFKPFVYMSTFQNLGWNPDTIILDTPVSFPNGTGEPFTPTNPAHNFSGPVTIRYALGNSLNVPADKAAAAVGPQTVVVNARKWGFVPTFRLDGCASGNGYGPAIATGGVDVTLEDMMMGYDTLANDGTMRGQQPIWPHDSDERQMDPVSILKVTNAQGDVLWDINNKRKEAQVVDPAYPYMIWDILSDPSAQCATFGCGGVTIPDYKAGVKTGTSEPYADNDPCAGKAGETWAFGYSPDLVVGIWAGNSDNDCVDHLYSSQLAFETMRDAFLNAHQNIQTTPFPVPDDLAQVEVCLPSGLLPTDLCGLKQKELFVKGKEPTEQDTWWQNVKIDTRTNQLAAPNTPQQFVQEKAMVVLPKDMTDTPEKLKDEQEKADKLGYELAPTDESTGGGGNLPGGTLNLPAAITYPISGQPISGLVQINGSATSTNFQSYTLEYGQGASPTSWTTITQRILPIPAGTLGVFNANGLAPGQYTIRLTVTDSVSGDTTYEVVVNVAGNGSSP